MPKGRRENNELLIEAQTAWHFKERWWPDDADFSDTKHRTTELFLFQY